jgi:hypothetical protein
MSVRRDTEMILVTVGHPLLPLLSRPLYQPRRGDALKSIDRANSDAYNVRVAEPKFLGIGEIVAMAVERRNLIAAMVV